MFMRLLPHVLSADWSVIAPVVIPSVSHDGEVRVRDRVRMGAIHLHKGLRTFHAHCHATKSRIDLDLEWNGQVRHSSQFFCLLDHHWVGQARSGIFLMDADAEVTVYLKPSHNVPNADDWQAVRKFHISFS